MTYPKIILIDKTEPESDVVKLSTKDLVTMELGRINQSDSSYLVETRTSGELTGRGIYLNRMYDWKIVTDSQGEVVLIAVKRKLNNE